MKIGSFPEKPHNRCNATSPLIHASLWDLFGEGSPTTLSLTRRLAIVDVLRMDSSASTTDAFERVLERGRSTLSSTRDVYHALETTESIPNQLVEAIGDLERELDELDQTLEVTTEDVALAEKTVERINVLSTVFTALQGRKRLTVETTVDRLDYRLTASLSLIRERGLAEHLDVSIDDVDRRFSMLQTLVDDGRYGQVETNDRISPTELAVTLQKLDLELADSESVDARVRGRLYLDVADDLLSDIHSFLSGLNEENPERKAYATDLEAVKQDLDSAREELDIDEYDDGDPGTGSIPSNKGALKARVALETCELLHQQTARAFADQRAAAELARVSRESGLAVSCDIGQCVAEGDVSTLLVSIGTVIASQAELSTAERLKQLLREHDGSVLRTAEATDFEVSTILDHLSQLYHEGEIEEIEVVFPR